MTTTTTPRKAGLDWPLMRNNIARADLDAVCRYLQQDDPILTAGKNVRAFEEEWSAWLGVKHSVFVNSGNFEDRWSSIATTIARSTRSGTFVGPGICRKWRPDGWLS